MDTVQREILTVSDMQAVATAALYHSMYWHNEYKTAAPHNQEDAKLVYAKYDALYSKVERIIDQMKRDEYEIELYLQYRRDREEL